MFAREAMLNDCLAQSAAVWSPEKVNDELKKLSADLGEATGRPEAELDRHVPTPDEIKKLAGY